MKEKKQTINDRLQILVNERCRGNKAAFCRSLGLADNALGNIIGGNRQSRPSIDLLVNVIETHNVDPLWLLTGKETPAKHITAEGDFSMASDSGSISMVVGDGSDRLALLEALIKEKDERIAVLNALVAELKAR